MKKTFLAFFGICLALCSVSFTSCLNEDNNDRSNFPNAIVTVKPATAKTSFYLQLDDSTVLRPVNMTKSPYGDKEVRAFVNFSVTEAGHSKRDYPVQVNWIDSILTKQTAPNLGDKNAETYGKDPVEIIKNWVTIAEDGYLTLRFRTYWSGRVSHKVNLVAGSNPKDPYEVVFYHHANGDIQGRVEDGVVAFRLSSLPDTQGKTVKLKLRWMSYSGEKTATFDYCTRKSSNNNRRISEGSFVKTLE